MNEFSFRALMLVIFETSLISNGLGGSSDTYFIYGTPGSLRGWAGINGGIFKPNEPPNNLDYEQTKISSAEYGNSFLSGFGINGLSYDPISKDILVLFSNNLNSNLAKIDPCKNEVIEEDKFYFSGVHDVYSGPFALYDSDIYYVALDIRAEGGTVFVTVTIRKVSGCQDKAKIFEDRDGTFKKECSVHVASIVEREIFNADDMEWEPYQLRSFLRSISTVGSTLFVTKHEEHLYFFVQIANPLYRSDRAKTYSLELYEVSEGGTSKKLYSSVENIRWRKHILYNVGDISYKDGLLCWSTYESIHCNIWPARDSKMVPDQILMPGESRLVCNVSSHSSVYQNIINGVQIVSAKDKIEILFGCWSGVTANGGAGFLSLDKTGSNKRIQMIEDKKGKIFAGRLAIIGACLKTTTQRRFARQEIKKLLNSKKKRYSYNVM